MNQLQDILQLLQSKEYKAARNLVDENPALVGEVIRIYFSEDYRTLQRISNLWEEFKGNHREELLHPYFAQWINLLDNQPHVALQRNSYRYFQDVMIPEEHQGRLYELAFADMIQAKSPIAVKAFAMKTCFNIAQHYPELLPELLDAIDIVSQSESKGVQARSRHIKTAIQNLLQKN